MRSAEDHPRRCGENPCLASRISMRLGSPPQVRGKRRFGQYASRATRITPAGAGKTFHRAALTRLNWDHPRRCGENPLLGGVAGFAPGSPPQVRGKLENKAATLRDTRITPAGAGKTLKRSFRNQPFCSGAVQISFNFSNSLNVSLQSGSAR